ncbi:MAG: C-5 sterol desaturase [Oceanicaulis sp.]|uniref:sterol desaturase family protein n=1 Tax=Oceanicaulis sp. UBA6590 TaxID=1947008 RepID=UPI000C54D376|nr:sterol desaturase family protein [Oceanicaulis sp. UBA6590]MAB68595.1 C-5 sterol desaturase [Oceanicaulis sp.]MBG35613.1 C-5 sterol desaturase [Oceanicaulis sp.]HCR94252.1 C-5 sterol desaturase [Oceanicaulis sp.]|tara:strand:+ start:2905 stop:3843 length:939 start_codon:yes stop_codon:yes gene_type:complete
MPNLPDPILWAIPGFILLVIAEMIYGRLTGKTRFEPRDTAASLVMGLGNTVSGLVLGGIVVAWFVFVEQFALLDIGWAWYWFVIAFVLDDFVYYWSHRWAHTVRWWWADHVVHHSSQHYNLSTALRQPWLNPLTLKFIFLGSWLVLIGFPPAMIAFVAAFNLIYQFWIHTEAIKRLPAPVEWLMNTPSHHRVHHATNPRYLDRNYAGVFIIWDRLFGTFEPETDAEEIRYGIVRNLGTHNPLTICLHEWWGIIKDVRSARSLRDALGYWLGPPGWSPDGSRDTSATLKARWMEEQGLTPPRKPDAQPPVAAE